MPGLRSRGKGAGMCREMGVLQIKTDQIKSHDGEGDAQHRRKIPPPVTVDKTGTGKYSMEHASPCRLTGISKAQQTDPGFCQHGTCHGKSGLGQNQLPGVGQDMPEKDMAVSGAQASGV